jgi:hypothetical protein
MWYIHTLEYCSATKRNEVRRPRQQDFKSGYIVRPFIKKERKKERNGQMPVAHTCNPSYSGGRFLEDRGSKPACGKLFLRPYLENT